MRSRTWMTGFFCLALLLYFPGMWWGLPDATVAGRERPWGTDELAPVEPIHELYSVLGARQPRFNPQYPLFQYITQAVLLAPYYVGLWLTGHLAVPQPNFPFGLDHPTSELRVMTLLARLPSLLMAAGIVAIAFRTGEILRDRRLGVLAAALVMLEYPMFYYARTSNVDMGALFWTALGLAVFADALMNGTNTRRLILFAVCGALATASKDPSYAVFVSAGVVLFVRHVRAQHAAGVTGFDVYRVPVCALGIAAVLYGVASGLLLRPSRHWRHLYYITHGAPGPAGSFYFRHPATPAGYLAVGRELAQQLVNAMGLPMLLCAFGGIALWTTRRRYLLPWIVTGACVVIGVILPVRYVLLRFVLIVAYGLAFCTADALASGWNHPRHLARVLARATAVALVAWGAIRGADLTFQMLYDSRYQAASWLADRIRPGERVGHVGLATNLPRLPIGVGTLRLTPGRLEALHDDRVAEFIISMPMQDFEPEHEILMPESVYQSLLAGSIGYRQAAVFQTRSLFRTRPVTFVNPPVRVFVRDDLWKRAR